MSTFEAISIQGIRSFDPKKAQVLEFLKPVTIILGQNGSGKTTIIESLKYATTGDFPPGSKVGGSFVHDIKLAQENEIKAEISLEIKDLKGNSLNVSRSLKATHKEGNKQITLATLDCSIKSIMSNGESVSISSKCTETNLEILNSLNISKSVLDNVIFSYQGKSKWTLFEGKRVKQLFDDLMALSFDYKALDNIRKRKIGKENEIKRYKTEIKSLKINRDEAQKKVSEKRVLELKIANFNAKIDEINEKLKLSEVIENEIIDLEKKIDELDQEIIHHHDSKMTEINKILKELWRNIYSGKDTEYIEICWDDETSNISKKRNYNYRVVMVKPDIRLDMLAYGSVSQKELASLLIRLALAEVFSMHCGVLCLDEPTKSLDKASIENLARALVRIIKNHSKEKDLQLILMTQDKKFLQLLGGSEDIGEFYEIKCNAKGHSEIKKTRIDHR